jgi:hypothetical protein
VQGLAVTLGLAAFAFLALGGNIGGANVFVYGIRVLKAEGTRPREALNPFGVEKEKTRLAASPSRLPASIARKVRRSEAAAMTGVSRPQQVDSRHVRLGSILG